MHPEFPFLYQTNYLIQIFFTNIKKENCMKAHSTRTHNKNLKCLNLRVYSAASVTTREPSHTLPVCMHSHSRLQKKKILEKNI